MKLSIVTLTLNKLEYTKKYIESLYKYTKDFELIIVDNASTDGTRDYLKTLKCAKIILNDKNVGFSKGNNQGIEIAEGEYIAFLNNDILLSPNWFEECENVFKKENAGFVSPRSIDPHFDFADENTYLSFFKKLNYKNSYEKNFDDCAFSCVVTKREVINKLGVFDENYTPAFFEDNDYKYRAIANGYDVYVCNTACFFHFGSVTSYKYNYNLEKNKEYYFKKFPFAEYLTQLPWKKSEDNKLRLVFDCTDLSYYLDADGNRAGIFNVALNLYRQFKFKANVEMAFVCDYKRYWYIKNIIKTVPEFSDCVLLKENSFTKRLISRFLFYTEKMPKIYNKIFVRIARMWDKYFYKTNSKNILQLYKYDAYFSPFTAPSPDVVASNLPIFRFLHDMIPVIEDGFPQNPYNWAYRIYNTVNKSDYYITNSLATKNDVMKYYPFIKNKNIITAYLAANENFKPVKTDVREKFGIPTDKKYILSVCSLGKRKNLIFAIRNFFKFIEKNNIDDTVLVLCGSTWNTYRRELNEVISKFDESKIILTGYVDDDDLPALYSNALMFIYPSLYEGFGLPILEAMQCGCPVITSNNSSLPEVIGEAGIQINPRNDDELVKAYRKMYFDDIYRAHCIESGISRAKMFSWRKCAEQILNFINSKSS